MIKLKKLVSCAVMAAAVSLGASAVQAMSVAIPSEGIGSFTAGSGLLIDFGVSDFDLTLTLGSPTGLTFLAEDCCIAGDQFGLILDHGAGFTPWTGTDFGGTFFGGTSRYRQKYRQKGGMSCYLVMPRETTKNPLYL